MYTHTYMCIYTHTYMCVCTYIYIYIYISCPTRMRPKRGSSRSSRGRGGGGRRKMRAGLNLRHHFAMSSHLPVVQIMNVQGVRVNSESPSTYIEILNNVNELLKRQSNERTVKPLRDKRFAARDTVSYSTSIYYSIIKYMYCSTASKMTFNITPR